MQIDRKVVEQALKALKDYERHTGFRSSATDDLRDALALSEPLGPGESWEYDDGLTMNRRVYRHGKLIEVIPIEIIQDTPQMRPFKFAHSFGNREHRPTFNQENV